MLVLFKVAYLLKHLLFSLLSDVLHLKFNPLSAAALVHVPRMCFISVLRLH
jgi:hypothetical protein